MTGIISFNGAGQCPRCERRVRGRTELCPNCGAPIQQRPSPVARRVAAILLTIACVVELGIVVAVAC